MENRRVDARIRLQEAALELFRESGYDRVTAAGIAHRAGVTERTFFRYFPDKREALFGGEAMIRMALIASITEGPADILPLDMLFRAFRSLIPKHEKNEAYLRIRHEIISATPALHERELAKLAALADALADALKTKGFPDLRADLAARTGMAAFVQAVVVWLNKPGMDLGESIDLAFHELKTLLTEIR